MKKIKLTENQYKDLVRLTTTEIINEQRGPSKSVRLMGTWESGMHSVNTLPSETKKELNNKIQELNTFIKENRGSVIKITIESSESKVTNYDNENNKKPLKSGELAKLRGDSIKQYLIDYYQKQVSGGGIDKLPIVEVETKIGGPDYSREEFSKNCVTNGKVDRESQSCKRFFEGYKPYQYVKLKIEAVSGACVGGIRLWFGYFDNDFTKGKKHHCDKALFNVLLNGIIIGVANLNNAMDKPVNTISKSGVRDLRFSPKKRKHSGLKTERDRIHVFDIRSTKVIKDILNANPDKVVLSLQGAIRDVHADIPKVSVAKLVDGKLKRVYTGYPNKSLERGSQKVVDIISFDSCLDEYDVL